MKQETRNLLIILTVVLVYLSYMYVAVESIIVHGYIIAYVLELIARKEIEPKDKKKGDIMGIDDWTIRFGHDSKIEMKGQGLGIVLTVVELVVSVVVGMWLDRAINMGIQAYTYPLGGLLLIMDISLHFEVVKVYEKGIQRGCKF